MGNQKAVHQYVYGKGHVVIMGKFDYKFSLVSSGKGSAVYECGEIVIRLDAVSSSCVRTAIYRKNEEMLPTFLVDPENKLLLSGRDRLSTEGFGGEFESVGNDEITLKNGIKLKIDTHNFLVSYYDGERLLLSDRKPLAYNFSGEFGEGCVHYLNREENEYIYGLGDKTGEMNKNGKAYRIEATDCMGFDASSTDPMYKHLPFYICENTAGCYGIFYDTSDTSYFDFGKEINNYYGPYKYFKTEDNCLVYYIFFGSKLSVLKQFSALCGKAAFPPEWSFDYCASTMAYTDAEKSSEKMDEFLEKLKSVDLSCRGFYLSSGYTSIGPQRYVFNWNYDKFPDPKAFIEKFSSNGIEIIPNIKPAFLNDHPMYEELKRRGLFVKSTDGTPFVTQFWDGLGSYLDFTNPEAFDFWRGQVKEKLLDYGITATWNDNNEFDIKDCDALAHGFGKGEVKAARIRNTLTYLMVVSSYTAQWEKYPDKRPFLSSRGSNAAIRRLAQTWSGDNRTEFKDLRYCNLIGLTMSVSGLGFYGHDLGGFTGDMPSRELLLRWLQLGLFQPRFTIHSWNRDGSATMPWSYDDIIPSVRALFRQRKQLVPYLYNCAYNLSENGEPINAPLWLYYDDERCRDITDSFMFGRDILVSCVFDEGSESVSVYLPTGDDWYIGGRLLKGGSETVLTIKPTDVMPYVVRAGSVIATDEAEYGFRADRKLVFTVYPVREGVFESEFFTDDGEGYGYLDNECVRLKFTVSCTDDGVSVSYINSGKTEITPEIRLCGEDGRRLVIC